MNYTMTAESVTEGHPDKVCDFIADSILDAYMSKDQTCRVACEVLCKENAVILAGEITSAAKIDHCAVVRDAIRSIGYEYETGLFSANGAKITQHITAQEPEISSAVSTSSDSAHQQGAGDQGIMFGYATNETSEMMPLPILLAHRLSSGLAEDRKKGRRAWIMPDGKTQVSVVYENGQPIAVSDVVVSTQHVAGVTHDMILEYVTSDLAPRVLSEWFSKDIRFAVNPSGSFIHGGPAADCGLTGRKNIVDTYGGACPHGGGSFSGKDPSKVDRSATYFCRYAARQVIKAGLAKKVIVNVAYAIGMSMPVAIMVDTMGTGNDMKATEFVRQFDFRPAAIVEMLNLLKPIYRSTTNYGHFGRAGFAWEE